MLSESEVSELVDPSYQPSKAELDDEINFREVVETCLENLPCAVFRPVKEHYIKPQAG